jgi:toxin ParE1/3/4
LIEIYVTIALDNEAAAERVCNEIEERVVMLREHSRLGVRRPEIAPSARMLAFGMYLVLYKTTPDSDEGGVESVEIVRVVHGHRDLSHIFADEVS